MSDKLDDLSKLYLNKRIAYTALLLQEYAYREILDSPLVKQNDRYNIIRKYNYVRSQIARINKNSGANKQQIKEGENIILDNISLIASINATLALMPSSQVDFIEEQFTKICLQAIDNEKKLNKNGKENKELHK
jgi:hypothetical protein